MTDDPRLAAAEALRALNHAFVEHVADEDLLDRIASFARQAVSELQAGERRDPAELLGAHVGRLFSVGAGADEALGASSNPMHDRAVGGRTNPMAADLNFEYGEDSVVVRTTLGQAYGGAPGRAHGGMVAALFDDVLGFVLPLAGTAAYTGQLTVRYHRPVPVGDPLEFTARIVGRDGRKLTVAADCHAGDQLVATAEALFITVATDRFGT